MFELNAVSWIGGRIDPAKRDNWMWSDGTAWDYTNWVAGTSNDEGCARMYEKNVLGQWNDKRCSDKRTFVCKKGKNTPNIINYQKFQILIYFINPFPRSRWRNHRKRQADRDSSILGTLLQN